MPRGGATILVAVQEAPIADLVRVNLRRQGYQVVVARTGEEALRQLDSAPPDLLILDMSLADVDAYELATDMRGKPTLHKIPIIGLVRRPAPDPAELRRSGVTSWLAMPFNPMELTAFVKRHLGHLADVERGVWHEVFKV